MASLSNITGKELIKFVKSIGYRFDRQKGNHRIFVHDKMKTLTIPVYKKKIVKIGLLGGILRDIGISKNEFIDLIM
ncbi:type II toxin-antitoxin system HicA family toxin [Aliarcobacter butzleri]|uniref:type II toxin-antitoxin system HicA family toxin n=1 Tax=Aliarcobacter butzleri TaxID=28197 RepID=UPI0021B4D8FF|nr:type II toxin-antitoxin system HicA family toxin [Aliarcobacter butzleri]MCT7575937.1 type II toxin-antitoxin system HicA family toxin [Aliarcobacter butzleri]